MYLHQSKIDSVNLALNFELVLYRGLEVVLSDLQTPESSDLTVMPENGYAFMVLILGLLELELEFDEINLNILG